MWPVDTMDYDQLLDKAVNAYLGWQMWEVRIQGLNILNTGPLLIDHILKEIVRKQFDIPINISSHCP